MCGGDSQLFRTDVEGSILNVCKQCSSFGKVMFVVREPVKVVKKEILREIKQVDGPDLVMTIVPDYGAIIKKKREELGIKQEDFAKQIKEKVSLVHKIEVEQFEPPIDLARKIERFLRIKIIGQTEASVEGLDIPKSEGFTIGDFIKVKK